MQESPQVQEERKLERRGWFGCLFVYLLAGIVMALVIALPDALVRGEPTQSAWLVLFSLLLLLVVTLVVGIGGLVLVLRLLFWSGEAERRRRQRGTAVFRQMLPGLRLDEETPAFTHAISSLQSAKPVLLILLFVVGAFLGVSVVGKIVDRVLPGVPGIFTSLITIALCLGILFIVGWAIGQSRSKPGAVLGLPTNPPAELPAQEQMRPGRSRAAGAVIFVILALVPLLGILSLVVRIPAPPFLFPILALGVCGIVFAAITPVYTIVPFLWIAGPVKRCHYDSALARSRLVERLSVFPGFYLNLHGVILLWAGRYEEARKTFEESIGEQRKEVMGGGSGALENIGCVLAWQGQYAEATKMFEGSIAITPQQAMVYSDLAEALLHQGTDLPRALELTERAWANQQASLEARWLSSYQGGQILANRAWALAKLGRHQEADETLARAFAIADKSFKPVLAGIYLRAGYVMLARGERARADEYFGQGQRLDPHGHYGRLCAEALQPGSAT